jgi:hypothetical protein
MNLICLLTLSKISKIIATASIFTNIGWFHSSSLTFLILVALLGNVLMLTFKDNLARYCDIGHTVVTWGNIVGHIILPLIIGAVLIYLHRKQSPVWTWNDAVKSCGTVVGVGLLYLVVMLFGGACSYGLDIRTNLWFALAWVVLAMGITPLSLLVFNK